MQGNRGQSDGDQDAPTGVEHSKADVGTVRVRGSEAGASAYASAPAPEPAPRQPALDKQGMPVLELGGRYADAGLIGRGGMGAVRSLHDAVLRREIAAKTLDRALAGEPVYTQGFIEEAQITAQLDHPNIVPVYELGTDASGTFYFTMKRVRGQTLHALLGDVRLPPGSSERLVTGLEVFLKACDAVAFAHSRGVLHRDIKPENIMVGTFGEVYLMDWGLAKVLPGRAATVDVPRDPNSPLAHATEGVVGTPAFMAPEVANRQFHRVDERTDIFGLGCVLYQIVTGRMPFTGKNMDEVMPRIRACDVVPPDAFDDAFVPKKLARVVSKAMAADPGERYATVGELAAQVREFLLRGHHLPRVVHPEGTVIVREGDAGDHAYIITRGRCEVYRMVGGERSVLREMGPGTVFGETAILGSVPRTASVVALTDVTTLVLTRELLEEKLAPDTWEGLLAKTLIDRFRDLDAKLTTLERQRLLT